MTRFSSVFIRVNLGAVKLWYLAIQIAHRSSPFIKLICDVNLTFQVKRLESSQPTEHPEFYLPNQENLLYTRILEIECDKKIQDALIFAPKKKDVLDTRRTKVMVWALSGIALARSTNAFSAPPTATKWVSVTWDKNCLLVYNEKHSPWNKLLPDLKFLHISITRNWRIQTE